MKTFNQYIIESKNTHMEHVEDMMFNEGVLGTRKAIIFLRSLRDMLAGNTNKNISRTVKWDGAPAVFAGVDPSDGKFFVAKKGVFNKNPKVYKTPADVKADTSGDLQAKLLVALAEFSKLGIKKGVYQGDLMFTTGDVAREKIDDQLYYTFQPNTIVYAIPVSSPLGRQISKAKIGVVWHTTYTGDSFENMSASFGKDIANLFNSPSSIWQTDATYRDESGKAVFSAKETALVTAELAKAGALFKNIPAGLLNGIANNEELKLRVKTFNNTFVRQGKRANPRTHAKALIDYITTYYGKESDKRSSEKGKTAVKTKQTAVLKIFTQYKAKDFENMFKMMVLLADIKQMIIDKMNQAGSMSTFLRTKNGFKVTAPEGFVAIDHLSNDAVKIVDRMEFSKANFSPEFIKGWEK